MVVIYSGTIQDRPGDKRLVAYMVAVGSAPDERELTSYLAHELPEFMVPSAYVAMDALPLTPNGKVDRGKLPPPTRSRREALVAPGSETERRIADIWREVLNIDEVGIRDTFFDLGGNSLLVMRLANRLSTQFDREVAVADVFRSPTVAKLAKFVSAAGDEVDAAVDEGLRLAGQRRKRRTARRVPGR